jgi:hypothetical protein
MHETGQPLHVVTSAFGPLTEVNEGRLSVINAYGRDRYLHHVLWRGGLCVVDWQSTDNCSVAAS